MRAILLLIRMVNEMGYPYRRNDIMLENKEVFKMVSGIYGQMNEWWDCIEIPDDIVALVRPLYCRVVCNSVFNIINGYFDGNEYTDKETKLLIKRVKDTMPYIEAHNEGECETYTELLRLYLSKLNGLL